MSGCFQCHRINNFAGITTACTSLSWHPCEYREWHIYHANWKIFEYWDFELGIIRNIIKPFWPKKTLIIILIFKNCLNCTIFISRENSEILIGSDLECMDARHNKLSQIIIATFRILYRVKTHMGLFEFVDIPNIWSNIGLY